MIDHAELARQFNKDEERVDWHDETLWWIRQKRDKATHGILEWEDLRETASQIKNNVLGNLSEYLLQFEKNLKANGVNVHWAADAEEHNQIVHSILKKHSVVKMMKSKSMLTEECHLNEFLTQKGIEVIDTDLGERIVQLAEEPPSHIVLPCIHKQKEEIGQLFHEKLGTPEGNSDPQFLTAAAREHMRDTFLSRRGGLERGKIARLETGGIFGLSNEGEAGMGAPPA